MKTKKPDATKDLQSHSWGPPGAILTSVLSEKEKYHMASLKYGIQKDMIQMNLLTKLKVIHRLRERTYGYHKERVGERARLRVCD